MQGNFEKWAFNFFKHFCVNKIPIIIYNQYPYSEIIKKNSQDYINYQNEQNTDIYNIKIDKKKIIIPIIEFEEVGFYLSIENFNLDIHNFIDKVNYLIIFLV